MKICLNKPSSLLSMISRRDIRAISSQEFVDSKRKANQRKMRFLKIMCLNLKTIQYQRGSWIWCELRARIHFTVINHCVIHLKINWNSIFKNKVAMRTESQCSMRKKTCMTTTTWVHYQSQRATRRGRMLSQHRCAFQNRLILVQISVYQPIALNVLRSLRPIEVKSSPERALSIHSNLTGPMIARLRACSWHNSRESWPQVSEMLNKEDVLDLNLKNMHRYRKSLRSGKRVPIYLLKNSCRKPPPKETRIIMLMLNSQEGKEALVQQLMAGDCPMG